MAAGVILAAGAGTRLGGVAKALLREREHTFLEHIVLTLRAVEGGPLVVVVAAPFGEQVAAHAREIDREVVIVDNPDPGRGMASSIALGFTALPPSGVDEAYLWPVDHPYVTRATLEALEAAIGRHDVARPIYRHAGTVRGGHPPLIARTCWPQLAACDRVEGGARAVISKLDVVDVPVDDPGVVRDIDTPEDRGTS